MEKELVELYDAAVLTKHTQGRQFGLLLWPNWDMERHNYQRNGGIDSKVESANGERSKSGKMQKSPSLKVEKGEIVKAERNDRNGTSKSSAESMKKVQNDVKNEKTDSKENIVQFWSKSSLNLFFSSI